MVRSAQDDDRRREEGGRRKKLLSACDTYRLVVGEIGIPRDVFLYEMAFWEIKAVIRGYNNRKLFDERTQWESVRWQTAYILQALGCKSIHHPSDLVSFSWDKEAGDMPRTEEEEEEELQRMRTYNERLGGRPQIQPD